jgi:hypothetical protein
LIFYFRGNIGYWNSITRCCISEKPDRLGRYYLDFSSKADYPGKFSKDGIPLFSYRGESLIEHPTVIAQYAFGIFEELYKKEFKESILHNKFIKLADWFEQNKFSVANGLGWVINVKQPEYSLDSAWISSMAQGQAISVLTRATLITGLNKFEKLAEDALSPLEFDVKDGGLINYFNSIPVYEEFPSPKKTMAVLNGFIFCLFGLYDLVLLNKNSRATNLFNSGIESLKKIIPYFDVGYWTRYYLFDYPKKYLSSYTYHILVTEQLKALFYITNDVIFKEYYLKWNNYSNNLFNKSRALLQKLFYANKFLTN